MQETGEDCREMVAPRLTKKKYRNQFKIIYDILDTCNERTAISKISRKANLSHYAAKPHLDNLVKVGYVVGEKTGAQGKYGELVLYKITEDGIVFKRAIEAFAHV